MKSRSNKSEEFWNKLATYKAAKAFLDYSLSHNKIEKIELLDVQDFFRIETIGDLGNVQMTSHNKRTKKMDYEKPNFTTK